MLITLFLLSFVFLFLFLFSPQAISFLLITYFLLSLNIGTCIFKRRELATSFETRSRFPELVIQEEKRVRFVVVNGLSIVEKPNSMHIEDAEW